MILICTDSSSHFLTSLAMTLTALCTINSCCTAKSGFTSPMRPLMKPTISSIYLLPNSIISSSLPPSFSSFSP